MLQRILLCGVAILFLYGCATTSNTVGGYHNDMGSGLSVYHQYQQTVSSLNKKGKTVHTQSVFKTDTNKDLPSNIVSVKLTMFFVNPYQQKFEVWETTELSELESNKVFLKQKRLRYISKPLPEELISIDMPMESDTHSQVIFSVDVLDENGKVLYTTYTARYKIGSEK